MDNIDNNILIDKQIRNNLPYTWSPFFSRFGKLTNIQRFTIPLILNGSNVVISSPKATGKTEAVLAPVLERQIKNPSDTLSIIYISPTRALVNDIYTRMKPAFDYLGV
ncbi:DEAD/DEAH box helicase, partial [candidate division WOR-3 bacterium]|nr:DEAD/DEAH box helicase [candidate division WOR-3 bacterium]